MSTSPEAAVEAQKLVQQESRALEKRIRLTKRLVRTFTLMQVLTGVGLLYVATSMATNGVLKDFGGNTVEYPAYNVTMSVVGFVISCWGRTEFLMDHIEFVSQRKP